MSEQWQFDFKDWHDAFEMFYRKKAKDSAFCLVISIAPYASGYWVERNAKSDRFAAVYRSTRQVKGLERRIKRLHEKEPRPMSFGLIT